MLYFICGLIVGVIIGVVIAQKKSEKPMSSVTAMIASDTVKRAFYK